MPPYFHYLDTQKVGNGTVADIATRAFANLLTAAGKKKNVCVVVSDLTAAYDTGGRLITKALDDAQAELGRQERNITPVDLATDEIYEILRKRLFVSLPGQAEIDDIAATFGRKLEEASKAKTVTRGAEALADEIAATYPFHPRLKNVIALFKENDQFKQTRGLIELVSRLLKSVWERPANDVFLIGPQHFDLGIAEVREKLAEISGMRDVIARDLWDEQQGAHAQVIDLQAGKDAAREIGALLLTASLSTAVNAVKGLTREEMVECLVTPLREPSDFLQAFEELEQIAWYLHHTAEGRYYFDRQENLTKLLQSLAKDAPANLVDDLIRRQLTDMFKPIRKTCYSEVLALAPLTDVADTVRAGAGAPDRHPGLQDARRTRSRSSSTRSRRRTTCSCSPARSTAMASVETAARQHYAAQKADGRIPQGHPQREDLERKQETYEQDFNSTILSLFDKVLFPIQPCRQGTAARGQGARPGARHEQAVQRRGPDREDARQRPAEALRGRRGARSTPSGRRPRTCSGRRSIDETRWADAVDRYAEQAGMPWMPPKGLDTLKSIACNRGLWEDLGNGYVTRRPKKKATSAQFIAEPAHGGRGRSQDHRPSAERRTRAPDPLRGRRPGHRREPAAQGPLLRHVRAAGPCPRPGSIRPVRGR